MPVCSTCGTAYSSNVRICVRDGTPLVTGRADHEYVGTLLDGKYRIDAFISSGGMGSVYRALHVMLDKTVAVKVIKNELVTSDEVVARFQREARAASNLNHPNIVSVYDLGQTAEGTLYIAMEFIDGPSVKEMIRRNGPLTPRESIDILRQVASALASAHRKQVVHRDLKSDNLMVTSGNVVKLVDFGIAKTFDDSTQLTAAGFMLGTPHYMSPEQAAGKPVDHRADLYSLGVILYEMLTGKVPFGETALTSMLVKLATEVPPPPSARRPDGNVPPALDAVAMRCLEKDPDRRFQSADEFIDALQRALVDIGTQPAIAVAPIATAEQTLVRPAETRPLTKAPVESSQPFPVSRPRAGLTTAALMTRVAAGLLVLGAAAAAIVFVFRPSNRAAQGVQPSASLQSPAPSATPEPALPPRAAPAVEAPGPAPAPPVASIPSPSPTPATSASVDGGRARIPPQNANPARTQTASVPPPPVAVTLPRSQAAIDPPAPVAAPAPAPTPPPAVAAPAASVTCQGAADVCDAIRSEIVRGLQDNQATADMEIRIKVALVSERPSTQFGAPSTVRTYSIDLAGSSRGTPIAMPTARVFGFDALFGRATLQENARQIAAGAVEAVRAAKGK